MDNVMYKSTHGLVQICLEDLAFYPMRNNTKRPMLKEILKKIVVGNPKSNNGSTHVT